MSTDSRTGSNAESIFEPGKRYKLTNTKFGFALTVDVATHNVVGSRYTGSDTQIWEAQEQPTGFWSLRNIKTELYLGIHPGAVAVNRLALGVSTHCFGWRVALHENGKKIELGVPYTNQVLNLENESREEKMKVHTWKRALEGSDYLIDTLWVVDSDLDCHPPLVSGDLYKIVSCNKSSVAHAEDSGLVSGFQYNGGQNQKWEAIPSGNDLWFFKNHFSGRYLGIKDPVAACGTRVVSVERPFGWDVAPKFVDGHQKGFDLYLPYTNLSLDLTGLPASKQPGAKMQVWTRTNKHFTFERVECITQCQVHIQQLLRQLGLTSMVGLSDENGSISSSRDALELEGGSEDEAWVSRVTNPA